MNRTVFCIKYSEELEGLKKPPYPGPVGERIYNGISKKAWKSWLDYQIMLINEYRLNMADKKAREYLLEQMEKFLFSDHIAMPEGYRPPSKEGKTE